MLELTGKYNGGENRDHESVHKSIMPNVYIFVYES